MMRPSFFFYFFFVLFFSVNASENLQTITIPTAAPENRQLEFLYRKPKHFPNTAYKPSILVMFGGRNWPAVKTFKSYSMDSLADKYNVYLISPSFVNDEYWQPEKWSGKALLAALEALRKEHGLKSAAVYYYGYSAGGQCANLFYFWKPELVSGIALHACGVYPQKDGLTASVPVLVTCGEKDEGRFGISYTFVQSLRENGAPVVFRNYMTGHGLNGKSLNLARCFLGDLLSGKVSAIYVSEDFTAKYFKSESRRAKFIDKEYRNPFFSKKTAEAWLEQEKK